MGRFQWHHSKNKVGEINISFVEYSASKSVHQTPDIVEYNAGANAPLYNLIIGKQTLYYIEAVLDFKEKTITIDSIGWGILNWPGITSGRQATWLESPEYK